MLYFVLSLLTVQVGFAFPVFNEKDISTWVRLDLQNLDSTPMQSLIEELGDQLETVGVFRIRDFLAEPVLQKCRSEILDSKRVNRKAHRTVFQDSGDYDNYDEKAPRNAMFTNSMDFVPRRHIEENAYLFQLYDWPPLLNFWRAIVGTQDLYLSTDIDGSVYGFVGEKDDWFAWHFDEHPFSCVWMLRRPDQGGFLQFITMKMEEEPDVPDKFRNARPWDRMQKFFEGDDTETSRMGNVQAQEGDVYCFWGNTTLHEITKIESQKGRCVSTFTYATVADFSHTDHVYEMNDWGGDINKEVVDSKTDL